MSSSACNMAQKIVQLADAKSVFQFCGSMPFQLVLSDKLRQNLLNSEQKPVVLNDETKTMMSKLPGYSRSSSADDACVFHGREVRDAKGFASTMVLQLVASHDDPEGWTPGELADYSGWGHDKGRKWRKASEHAKEGNNLYGGKFGAAAFGLHHRCYWHLDSQNGLWLAAEDGCEGVLRDW